MRKAGITGVLAVVVGGVATSAPAVDRPAPRECTYEVVRADEGERSAAFVGWLEAHPDVLGDAAYLLDEPGRPFEILIADVDNDGRDEHVVASRHGSGYYLSMWVFRASGEAWARVTPTPLDGVLGGARDYRGPRLDSSHLLVRFCGRTYVNLLGGQVPNYFPDSYVWEEGRVRRACDTPWLTHHRREFQSLFDQGFYDEAHLLLDGLQASCAEATDPALRLRMRGDLALTAYRMKSYQACLAHTAAAEKSRAFASAAAAVKKAIAANAARCAAARKKGIPGDPAYDFSWLPKVAPRTQIVFEPRFDGLLSAVVPEAALPDGPPLRDALKLSLWLAEAPSLEDGRYLFLAGCEPLTRLHSPSGSVVHGREAGASNCGNRGFVWIDTVRRQAILAAGDTLGSTTIEAAHIPDAFWRRVSLPAGTRLRYVQPDGRTVEIQAPAAAD